MSSPGAPPIERGTAVVNGIALPDALLVPDDWLPSLFVSVSPVEVSWFAGVPVARAVAVCAAVTGVRPHVRRVVDRYFDTPERDLFRRRVSVRLRQHVHPRREVAFEIIATGWAERASRRRVSGFVQTFGRNDDADIPRVLERYAAAGYEQVARFDKERHTFSLLPGRSMDASGTEVVAGELKGAGRAHGWLQVLDFGLKVEVDRLRRSPFPEPAIIEVDYDSAHEERAAPLAAAIRAALGPRLREKTTSKLAYLLGGG
jgi:hypothetical protein